MARYTDDELREILDMTWKEQDDAGKICLNRKFVRKYIPSGLVPPEDEARLLMDRAHLNISFRISNQEGSVFLGFFS